MLDNGIYMSSKQIQQVFGMP